MKYALEMFIAYIIAIMAVAIFIVLVIDEIYPSLFHKAHCVIAYNGTTICRPFSYHRR